ncbi:hypothetical protein [Nonomuraea sp. NPDC050643]|uniref:hypothetical protein n=1 Tax=Nonomuraea sp. NPDC050643 TaxID=3155660 RepID=UPI0033EFA570
MGIDLTFTLTSGGQYKQRTSDFGSLDECHQHLAAMAAQDLSTITFSQPDGTRIILPCRNIVAVECKSAGDR